MKLALVAAAKYGGDASAFLANLPTARELALLGVEVHIVTDGALNFAAPHAAVVAHQAEPNTSLFHLWGIGVASTAAEYIAILDINCPPDGRWLGTVLDRLSEAQPSFFGTVDCAFSDTDPGMIGYLVEYVQFQKPLDPTLREVAGNNFIMRRELAGKPDDLRRDGFSKTAMLTSFVAQGLPPPEPVEDIVILFQKPFAARPYFTRRYRHGRCYAAQRYSGLAGRLKGLATTPLLPFVRVGRILSHASRTPRTAAAFRRRWLVIGFSELCWSWGEAVGYAIGEGDCRAKLD